MRPVSLTSAIAALLLNASASAALAQSAVIDLSKRSGPSRFVSEANGKPAQMGVSADQHRVGPEPIAIIPTPQTSDSKDPPPDSKSTEKLQDKKPQDKEPADGQKADKQATDKQAADNPAADGQDSDSETAENKTADSQPSDGQTRSADKPPGEATASAPDADSACDAGLRRRQSGRANWRQRARLGPVGLPSRECRPARPRATE